RAIHFASFPLFFAGTLHAFMAGTDANGGVFTVVAIVTSLAIVLLTIRRVNQARRPTPPTLARRIPTTATAHRIDDPGLVSSGR
ncbi:MAG: hypothetical protein JWL72_2151, partial [Ilumatobacteraceae bacterium]|nr:hypothetical protein [Ilumatobacteraceae bacterium]